MPKEKIEFASSLPPKEAANYLESLAKGLREGAMLVESGDSSVTVQVAEEVRMEIEFSSDPDKGKTDIEVALSWRQRRQEELASPPSLLIAPGAPSTDAAIFSNE